MATEKQSWAVVVLPDNYDGLAIPMAELDRFLQNVQYVSVKRYQTGLDRFIARNQDPVHEVNIISNDHFNLLKVKEKFNVYDED